MPGTIQVSVLEFKRIASSSPPSSVLIKVSLGKKEHQTWDKGDFSFPLTTLRDSLIITFQDAEGNELSNIGVHAMTIVEKGIWDDLFPLEGGGHVHMKLQFSLSEDERNRIRGMRESALKKKQREVLSKKIRYSGMASDVGDSIASSSPIDHEVSELLARGVGKQAGPLPHHDTFSMDLQSNNGKEEATLQKHIVPNATDDSEQSSSAKISPRTEIHHMSVTKIDTELPHYVVSKDHTFMSRVSEPVVPKIEPVVAMMEPVLSKLEDTPVSKHEKQVPLRKQASSIRKMISAFETALVQEKKPPIVQVAAKSQSNRARKEGPLKDEVLAHVTKAPEFDSGRPELLTELSSGRLGNQEVSSSGRVLSPAQISSERLRNSPLSGKLQQLPPDRMNKGKHIGFHQDIGNIKSSAATRQLLISNTSNLQQAKAHETVKSELKSNHKEGDKSPAVLMETSLEPRKDKVPPEIKNRGEQVDFAKKINDNKLSQDVGQVMESADASIKSGLNSDLEESNIDQDNSSKDLMPSSTSKASTVLKQMEEKASVKLQPFNVYDGQKSSQEPSFIEGLKEIKIKYSNEILVSLNEKLKTVVFHQDEQHQHESSSGWIFPNDTRRMCVTTGVSPVIDLYDGCHAEGKAHNFLVPEDLDKHAVGSKEMKESESSSLKLRNTEPESSADNSFTGPLKQAIKLAVLVGFGALVLFTRQREPRKSGRKTNDHFFNNLPCTDLQTSLEK